MGVHGLVSFVLVAVAAEPNSDPEYRKLRDAQLEQSFVVENVVIRKDAGVFTLKKGFVSFVPDVLGRVTAGVFLGEGEFAFTPPPGIERSYLKSIIDQDSVKEPFQRAVFCFTDDTYRELRGAARPIAVEARAQDYLRDFRRRVRHRTTEPRSLVEAILSSESMENIEADTLADLYNPKQPGFFSAYINGRKYSDLRFHVKPRGAMADLPAPDEVALMHLDPEGSQEGIWYLAHFKEELERGVASAHEDKRVVAAEGYRIVTEVGKNDRLTATAEFRFQAVTDQDRVVKFGLLPSLRVSAVRAGDREVSFIQEDRKEDASFYVIMPEPMAKGRSYQLVIEYHGDKVIHKAGGGNFSVGARTSWYPSVNAFNDRAKFDLTFKAPKDLTLVSVGKLAKEWKEGQFSATQWISDVPMAVAGFNYGSYKKKQMQIESIPYTVEGYATSSVPDYLKEAAGDSIGGMSPTRLTDQAISQAQAAVRVFDRWFGRAPYGRIAITQQPEFAFGQSWPTLVYLPVSAFLDSTQRWQLLGINTKLTEFIQEVTPHEVAHQWWGHMVGWATFRDQWLSEGFADFSAGLYLQFTEARPDKYLRFLEHARDAILEKNSYGRSANDAGPLSLGLRLSRHRNQGAYNKLVYPKGGYVLHMLRYLMWDPKTGDEPFIKMMRDFVESHLHRNASTESFKAVVEKHMNRSMDLDGNGRMDWFFRQWVYDTEVPRYQFQYTLDPGQDGRVLVKASLTQSGVSDNFKMLVPIYADFDGKLFRLGQARLLGNKTVSGMEIPLPRKPRRVLINANHDVLEQK